MILYQEVYIRPDEVVRLDSKVAQRILSRGKELLERLADSNYQVLSSTNHMGTTPASMLIGSDNPEKMVNDITRIFQEFQLPFSFGKQYQKE